MKMKCNPLWYNIICDKKFWDATAGPLHNFIEKGTLAILVIAATLLKLQKITIPFWKGDCIHHFHVVWLK